MERISSPQICTSVINHNLDDPAGSSHWACLGAVSVNKHELLIFWDCSWHSASDLHHLRRLGHNGWPIYGKGDDEFLIAWEPTIERKSIQESVSSLVFEPEVEVRKGRPGLLGYVVSRSLPNNRLAFLALWKVAPMAKELFYYLQDCYSSHRGSVVHAEGSKVWVQWEPTWVYHEDMDRSKRELYLQLHDDPEGLWRCFHKRIVTYSSRVAALRRLKSSNA